MAEGRGMLGLLDGVDGLGIRVSNSGFRFEALGGSVHRHAMPLFQGG